MYLVESGEKGRERERDRKKNLNNVSIFYGQNICVPLQIHMFKP